MATERDPVCGMEVDTETSDLEHDHDGRTYRASGGEAAATSQLSGACDTPPAVATGHSSWGSIRISDRPRDRRSTPMSISPAPVLARLHARLHARLFARLGARLRPPVAPELQARPNARLQARLRPIRALVPLAALFAMAAVESAGRRWPSP